MSMGKLPADIPLQKMDVSQVLTAIHHNSKNLVRDGIAYDRIYKAASTAAQWQDAAEPVPGIPVFSWTANVGGEAVDMSSDLQQMSPEQIVQVLNPLCHYHANKMLQQLTELQKLLSHLQAMFKPSNPNPDPPRPASVRPNHE